MIIFFYSLLALRPIYIVVVLDQLLYQILAIDAIETLTFYTLADVFDAPLCLIVCLSHIGNHFYNYLFKGIFYCFRISIKAIQ
jgi:hypothetical protein